MRCALVATPKVSPPAFTLIEVVIAVALVGILLTMAIPSYQRYMERSHRAEAIRMILVAADCQSRIKAETGFFDTTRCAPDQDGTRYSFSFQPPGDASAGEFAIIAAPVEKEDRCGALGLDHSGNRSIGNPDGDVLKCWGGR